MRRLWKKLCWVSDRRPESILLLGLGGCLAALSPELDGLEIPQNVWHLLAALLCAPFIGSLCSAPSFKEEKMKQDKIRWRDRRLCDFCKEYRMVGLCITLGVSLILLFIDRLCCLEVACIASIAGCVFLTSVLVAGHSCVSKTFCNNCREASMQVVAQRKEREAQAKEEKMKPRPMKLCAGCKLTSGAGFFLGIVSWILAIPLEANTDIRAYIMLGAFSAIGFAVAFAFIVTGKYCKDCDALKSDEEKNEEVRSALCTLPNELKGIPSVLVGAGDFIEGPDYKLTTPLDDEAFRLKARQLLADIHLQVSGGRTEEAPMPTIGRVAAQIPEVLTHEECERRIRAYLEDRGNVGDLLMRGMYAADVAKAIGYPYTMVRDTLSRMGKSAYVKLLNSTLILRSYGYPSDKGACL